MVFCRIADFLYAAVPLRLVRGLLIRGHMERCPHCQARLIGPEEARGLLVAPDGVGDPQALWRRISAEAEPVVGVPEIRLAGPRLAWRWAAAVAVAIVVSMTGFWLLRETERTGFEMSAVGPVDRFELGYVNVGGVAAQTFVYQPQGTDTVFIWASRIP